MNLYIVRSFFFLGGVALALNAMLGTPVYGMQRARELGEDARPQPQLIEDVQPQLLPDIWFKVYSYLPRKDLDTLHVASKGMHESCLQYEKNLRDNLIGQINTLDPTMSRQQISYTLSRAVKNNQNRDDIFMTMLEAKMKDQLFFFVAQGSPLAPSLHNISAILKAEDLIEDLDLVKEIYKALFKHEFPKGAKNDKVLALRHIQAAWPFQGIYVSNSSKQEGTRKFLEYYHHKLKASPITASYFPFNLNIDENNTKILAKNAHHIVVTEGQLMDRGSREKLEELLACNPHHTVILSNDGVLFLTRNEIPPSLRRLRLVDAEGSIIAIGDYFLCGCEGLTSVDLSGLINVRAIGDYFLNGCTGLTSVDLSGLINLREIGDNFLRKLPGLINDEEEKNRIVHFIEAVGLQAPRLNLSYCPDSKEF